MGSEKGILIAQLGRGTYVETIYKSFEPDENKLGYSTGYTFEAVLKKLLEEQREVSVIMLVGTEGSYWGTLCDYYLKTKKEQKNESAAEVMNRLKHQPQLREVMFESYIDKGNTFYKLANPNKDIAMIGSFLSEKISSKPELGLTSGSIKVKPVIIKNGATQEELEKNFYTLKNEFSSVVEESNAGDSSYSNVYFDISNGFRSLPMYIYTFINYLSRVQNQNYQLSMYYGMADGRIGNKAPLVDLKQINSLMEWLDAANEFHSYGSVNSLIKVLGKEENDQWQKDLGAKLCRVSEENRTKELKNIFGLFDYATNANNFHMIYANLKLICEISSSIDQIPGIQSHARELLKVISDNLRSEFQYDDWDRISHIRRSHLSIHLADWYYRQQRIGNAATALQEGLTTYILEKWPYRASVLYYEQTGDAIEFLSDNDQEDPEYLSANRIRTIVGDCFNKLIMDHDDNGDKDTLRYRMNFIRTYFRNPAAHMTFDKKTSITELTLFESREIFQTMIHQLLEAVDNDSKIPQTTDMEIERIFDEWVPENGETEFKYRFIVEKGKELLCLGNIKSRMGVDDIQKTIQSTSSKSIEELLTYMLMLRTIEVTQPNVSVEKQGRDVIQLIPKDSLFWKVLMLKVNDNPPKQQLDYTEALSMELQKKGRSLYERLANWITNEGKKKVLDEFCQIEWKNQ